MEGGKAITAAAPSDVNVSPNETETSWSQIRGFLELLRVRFLLKIRRPLPLALEILLPVAALYAMVLLRDTIARNQNEENLFPQIDVVWPETLGAYIMTDIQDFNRDQAIAVAPEGSPTAQKIHGFLVDALQYINDDFVARNVTDETTSVRVGREDEEFPLGYGPFDSAKHVQMYKSEQEIVKSIEGSNYPPDGNDRFLKAAIIVLSEGPDFRYKIRMNFTGRQRDVPYSPTSFINNLSPEYQEFFNYEVYLQKGFVFLQALVDAAIIGDTIPNNTFSFMQNPNNPFIVSAFPVPPIENDDFADLVGIMLGLLLVFGYIYSVTQMSKSLMSEKEDRIRELLKVIGITEFQLYVSWVLVYSVFFFLQALIITAVVHSGLYSKSNFVLVFLLFFLFDLSLIGLVYLMSAFFTRQRVASIFTALFFMGMSFVSFALDSEDSSESDKNLSCLLAPVCAAQGATVLTQLDSNNLGITMNNINEPFDRFAYSTALYMLFIDFLLYSLLGAYLSLVVPSTYGISLPPWFFLLPSYWKRVFGVRTEDNRVSFIEPSEINNPNFEPVPESIKNKVGVSIRGLGKCFPATNTVAVDNLSVDMYRGQVFSLLGHNGAGKSTTISMLNGFFPPTSGDAFINDRSIRDDMGTIRKSLGVVPQHDALWPYLTVREHLRLYASIKMKNARNSEEINKAIGDMITQVGLTEKRHVYSSSLSGGQKRKLSLATALIGDSKVVFLDEVTSGMDPYSRRSTWEMIKKAKKNRTIILTTHFLDEADYLGDRIGIMHQGKMQCCGSSLFLKNLYGVGYVFTADKMETHNDEKYATLIKKHIPKASLLSNVAGETSYRLPFESSADFPEMFEEIDATKEELGVSSYGISVTTLEEVFLRVGEADNSSQVAEEEPKEDKESSLDVSIHNKYEKGSMKLFVVHLQALLLKRWNSAKRDRKVWLWQIMYPTILLVVGIVMLLIGQSFEPITLELSAAKQYKNDEIVIAKNRPASDTFFEDGLLSKSLVLTTAPDETTWDNTKLSRYLLDTRFEYSARQGAFLLRNPGESLHPNGGMSIFYNSSAYHSLPIYFNQFSNVRLSQQNQTGSIIVESHPFPLTARQRVLQTSFMAIIVSIAFAFIPASYVAYIVRERETKVMHQQIISGVSKISYWFSNWIWDIINMIPPILICLILLAAFDIRTLVGADAFGPTICIMLLYAFAVTPFTYLLGFLFTDPSSAQNVLLLVYCMAGTVLLIVYIVMSIISSTQDLAQQLIWAFRLFPNFAFSECISALMVREIGFSGQVDSPWSMDIFGYNAIYLFTTGIGYGFAIALLEFVQTNPGSSVARFLTGRMFFSNEGSIPETPLDQIDEDVLAEKKRLETADDFVKLRNLHKMFISVSGAPLKHAVKGISFGIRRGEVMGFLGVNGAGKTTTLRMLTGDEIPSKGTATIKGYDILTQQDMVRYHLGFCPQFDALIPTMTAREHLDLFAAIKGAPVEERKRLIDPLISELGLTQYADKPCGGYSGGNRRKLSVGISLIGDPSVCVLDEPSTGMDPKARRSMWRLISSTMQNRAVILTTHAMEECMALSHKIGIMVSGRLRCLGTSQHLKSKFGNCYQMDLNLGNVAKSKTQVEANTLEAVSTETREERLLEFMKATFEGHKLLEHQGTYFKFRIEKTMTLANIFRSIEPQRSSLGLTEYSVSEMSLDQIFIYFARQQDEEKDLAPGLVTEE